MDNKQKIIGELIKIIYKSILISKYLITNYMCNPKAHILFLKQLKFEVN